MKEILTFAVAVALIHGVLADAPKPSKLTPEERAAKKAEMQKKMLKHTGGFVVKPNTQKGEIVYVNCQSAADEKWIKDSASYFAEQSKFKISVKKGAFDLKAPKIEGNMSIFIVDDPALPPLLVAPENRWSMVNVAPLKAGNGEKPAFLESRTRKELARAFAYLCGGVSSQYPGAATSNVTKTEDLDQIIELRLPLDFFQRFKSYMPAFGVTPAEQTTYRRACEEGWASQPTNDIQKAVWDKVHEVPTKPIKIEFDPKTDTK